MNGLDFLVAAMIKVGGAVAGTALSLIFQPPKTWAEFVTRGTFSVLSAVMLSEPVREWLHWPLTVNMELASLTLTALLSWFVMGALTRLISAIDLINIIRAWRSK